MEFFYGFLAGGNLIGILFLFLHSLADKRENPYLWACREKNCEFRVKGNDLIVINRLADSHVNLHKEQDAL